MNSQPEPSAQPFTSGLTSVPDSALALAPARTPEATAGRLAVVVVGVDRLREITDALGPPAGDQVLAVTAARLGAVRRTGMMLTPLLADAFALVLAGVDTTEEILSFAEELLAATSAPITVEDEELLVSVSIGVAFGSDGPASARGAMRDAATAQHRAQQRGGGCVEVFAPQLGAGLLETLRLEGELRAALANREGLSLFFQPIMSLTTGEVSAVEALVRWDHPMHGLLLPSRFLPLAERTGLLAQIERWVIDEACVHLAKWNLPRCIAVNVSATALDDPGFVTQVAENLRRYSLDANQLIIELSDSALQATHSATRVEELRTLGVSVFLDDFGTGYSWLAQLKRLPVDGVKLGRSLVAELATAGIASVIEGIVEAAATLGLNVVATGVETKEQLDSVRELGVGSAQGLHFLGPVPAAVLIDVLALSGDDRPRPSNVTALPDVAALENAASEERAVTLGHAAKLLGISASTLRRWTEDGRVTAVRTSGGHRRFYVSELARVNAPSTAQLRLPAMPDRAVPDIADLLHSDGVELAGVVARSMYEELPGWFGQEQALEPTRQWIADLAAAFEEGTYEHLEDSLRRYMLSAAVGGTTLAERHVFLERFGPVLETQLNRRDRPQREQAAARRTISALALLQLADNADPAATPKPPSRPHRVSRLRHRPRATPQS